MNEEEKDLINDLWFTLSWYVDGYPFDSQHKIKHKMLIKRAQRIWVYQIL